MPIDCIFSINQLLNCNRHQIMLANSKLPDCTVAALQQLGWAEFLYKYGGCGIAKSTTKLADQDRCHSHLQNIYHAHTTLIIIIL